MRHTGRAHETIVAPAAYLENEGAWFPIDPVHPFMTMIRNLALLAGACAAMAAAVPARPEVCSIAPAPSYRPSLQLIVTATADTLPAGPGSMQYRVEAEYPGAIYGQVARVERVGGADAAGLPAATDRVVLVPWDRDAGCQRVQWSSGARWIQPGARGLVWSSLRPREQWVDGLPTLDVSGDYQAPSAGATEGLPADSALTVEQLFDLVDLLPEYEADGAGQGDDQPLLRWAAANPGLARLYPAQMMVQHAVYAVRDAWLKRIDPALGGTYRFRVWVDGGAPRALHGRTYSRPVTEWDPSGRFDDDPAPLNVPITGYTLMLSGSSSEDSLPAVFDQDPERRMARDGYVSVMTAPDSTVGGVQIWRGEMDLNVLARALPGDSVLVRLSRAEDQARSARIMAGEAIEPMPASARFLLRPDGSVTMEQESVLSDGRRVRIRGERISRVTIPDPD